MQEKNKLILIDADFILWKTVPNKVLSDEQKKQGIKSEKNLQETFDSVDWYIENKIFIPTEATHYIGFLGGKGNFRKKLTDTYKANRAREFPKYFNLAKQYLIEEYGFVESHGFEAEDYVNFIHNKIITEPENHIFGDNVTIVREDHDLDQIAGLHYNPTKNEFKPIGNKEAHYNLMKQALTGCSTDKVVGILGIGEKKAEKIINEAISKNKYLPETVLEHYISAHHSISNGIYEYALNVRQLYLLKDEQDFMREIGKIPEFPRIINVKDLQDDSELEEQEVEF